MITLHAKGDFSKTETTLQKMLEIVKLSSLDKYGKMGVDALSAATPKRTGLTANSWTYEISHDGGYATIVWKNENTNKGFNVAIMLQYGHGTGTGGYVSGRDYINPAMKPVFDQIAEDVRREVMDV